MKSNLIISIHGTFAAHPDDEGAGPQWQRGSNFAQRRSVKLGDTEQTHYRIHAELPNKVDSVFHWSGANSETARRMAARLLLQRLSEWMDATRDGKPDLHLIAHSHGGNVLWEALVLASAARRDRENQSRWPFVDRLKARFRSPAITQKDANDLHERLKSWTSVGTPFLHFVPDTAQLWWLFPVLTLVLVGCCQARWFLDFWNTSRSFSNVPSGARDWLFLKMGALTVLLLLVSSLVSFAAYALRRGWLLRRLDLIRLRVLTRSRARQGPEVEVNRHRRLAGGIAIAQARHCQAINTVLLSGLLVVLLLGGLSMTTWFRPLARSVLAWPALAGAILYLIFGVGVVVWGVWCVCDYREHRRECERRVKMYLQAWSDFGENKGTHIICAELDEPYTGLRKTQEGVDGPILPKVRGGPTDATAVRDPVLRPEFYMGQRPGDSLREVGGYDWKFLATAPMRWVYNEVVAVLIDAFVLRQITRSFHGADIRALRLGLVSTTPIPVDVSSRDAVILRYKDAGLTEDLQKQVRRRLVGPGPGVCEKILTRTETLAPTFLKHFRVQLAIPPTGSVALLGFFGSAVTIGPERYDLRMMSSVNDIESLPREGKNLIVVAAVGQVLHVRIFDSDGKTVVDADETKLTDTVEGVQALKQRLGGLWPPHELTWNEKDWLITLITSIVGHTRPEWTGLLIHTTYFEHDEVVDLIATAIKEPLLPAGQDACPGNTQPAPDHPSHPKPIRWARVARAAVVIGLLCLPALLLYTMGDRFLYPHSRTSGLAWAAAPPRATELVLKATGAPAQSSVENLTPLGVRWSMGLNSLSGQGFGLFESIIKRPNMPSGAELAPFEAKLGQKLAELGDLSRAEYFLKKARRTADQGNSKKNYYVVPQSWNMARSFGAQLGPSSAPRNPNVPKNEFQKSKAEFQKNKTHESSTKLIRDTKVYLNVLEPSGSDDSRESLGSERWSQIVSDAASYVDVARDSETVIKAEANLLAIEQILRQRHKAPDASVLLNPAEKLHGKLVCIARCEAEPDALLKLLQLTIMIEQTCFEQDGNEQDVFRKANTYFAMAREITIIIAANASGDDRRASSVDAYVLLAKDCRWPESRRDQGLDLLREAEGRANEIEDLSQKIIALAHAGCGYARLGYFAKGLELAKDASPDEQMILAKEILANEYERILIVPGKSLLETARGLARARRAFDEQIDPERPLDASVH